VRFVIVAAVVWVVALLIAAILVGDRAAIARFERAGPSIAAMTIVVFVANHLLRFVRWQWMLVNLGAQVPTLASFGIFMAGLGLLPTPGKIGVAARSMLLERYGMRVHVSLAAYFAERLFDLVGLFLLAAIYYQGPLSRGITIIAVAGVVCIALVVRFPDPLIRGSRQLVRNCPKLVGAVDAAAGLLHAASRLLVFPQALAFVLLGMLANVAVGLLVWGVLLGLSEAVSIGTGIGGVALAHLTGSASLSPGGLGGFELALLLDLHHVGIEEDDALIAVACVRIVTLWAGSLSACRCCYPACVGIVSSRSCSDHLCRQQRTRATVGGTRR
jgi:hypothetical protein